MSDSSQPGGAWHERTAIIEAGQNRVSVAPGSAFQRIDANADALLRMLFLVRSDMPFPQRLHLRRYGVLSPAGEDGLILALAQECDMSDVRFAELGLPRRGTLLGYAARELGWTGSILHHSVRELGRVDVAVNSPRVTCIETRSTDERQIADCVADADVVAVDAGWCPALMLSRLEETRAGVLCMPYAPEFGLEAVSIVPSTTDPEQSTLAAGSSLVAIVDVAASRGYRLVAVEPDGCTAFLLRSDIAPHVPELSVRLAYAISHGRVTDEQATSTIERAEAAGVAVADLTPAREHDR